MNNSYNEKTHTSIKQLLKKFSSKAPGFTYIASFDSGVTYKGAVGLASIKKNLPITTKTVFNIASVSKQFTAFSILLLEQERKLSLDDSIVKFIPFIGTYAEPVTLRHLIHHTGGLVDYMELAETATIKFTDTLTVEESLNHLNGHQIARFAAGTKFEYSNTGYFLLSLVVEKVSGKFLRQFAKERIFDPLHMKDTTIVDCYPTTISIASGYSRNEQGTYKIYESPWEHTGDGAVHTTVEDLVKWGENLTTGTVGGKNLAKRMSEIGPEISSTGDTIIDNEDYAFGLRLANGFNCRYLEHSGSWAGYRSHFMRFPKEYLSVVVLSNNDEFDSKKYANEIAGIVLEK
ncbi:serine hydrolase domain-containing protein [Bacillus cereus]|uniref:serine hydrolase domain-containing protein n=1 Tax=Bacillus cereus TaxID=1396 RepID=UPI00363AC644